MGFVVVNAFHLNESQIQWFFSQLNLTLRPGKLYWYDKSSGFLGKLGKTHHVLLIHVFLCQVICIDCLE
jgi:hypothetical protein